MKVHHGEGVASHTGPESCGARREARVEALTGVRIGWVLSRESSIVQGADAVASAEGDMVRRATRVPGWPCVVEDPSMCARSLRGNREISHPTGLPWQVGPHREGRRAEADGARAGEVGQVRSTCEVPEQNRSPAAEGMEGRRLVAGRSCGSTHLGLCAGLVCQTLPPGHAAGLHRSPRPRTPRHYHPRQEPDARIGPVRICAGGAQQCASLPRPMHIQPLSRSGCRVKSLSEQHCV